MLANYYTLKAIVRELDRVLAGVKLSRTYCFRKDELRLHFVNGDTIVALLTPVRGALYLTHSEERLPKRNVASFFPELDGLTLTRASISESDREITLEFAEHKLQLHFFGSPNAILFQGEETVSAFKRLKAAPRNTVGSSSKKDGKQKPQRQHKTSKEDMSELPKDLPGSIKPASKLDLLGKRLTLEYEAAAADGKADLFIKDLEQASGVWLYELPENVLLSPVELKTGLDSTAGAPRFFVSPSDGVRRILQERHTLGKFRNATNSLVPKIEQALKRTISALTEIERAKTHTSRAEDAQEIGKALLAQLSKIPRGAATITLELAAGEREVKLDPKLTASQNVDKYFDRAKRSREAQIELLSRQAALEKEKSILERLKEQATLAEGTNELEKITDAYTRLMNQTVFDDARAKAQADDPFAKFRKFTVAGGLPLLVGKSAAQNDELTLHVAKKEDIWLHARGVAGSHAVLQTSGIKGDQVPREAIEQAAQIAAYFSDAKTQSLAPVSFTRKKYVRKPRGAAPGAVLMEREEVVLVRPGLPKEKE